MSRVVISVLCRTNNYFVYEWTSYVTDSIINWISIHCHFILDFVIVSESSAAGADSFDSHGCSGCSLPLFSWRCTRFFLSLIHSSQWEFTHSVSLTSFIRKQLSYLVMIDANEPPHQEKFGFVDGAIPEPEADHPAYQYWLQHNDAWRVK